MSIEGILLVNKPIEVSSFQVVKKIRYLTKVKKVGHAGTLDPLANGLLIILIGSKFTKQSDEMMKSKKEYETNIFLGAATTSFDSEGDITDRSTVIPSLNSIETAIIDSFDGWVYQMPPIFSAKKINGRKAYDLARENPTADIGLKAKKVWMSIKILDYSYPILKLRIECTSGTYIRSIANDLGKILKSYGYCKSIYRTKVGNYSINDSSIVNYNDINIEDIESNIIR